MGMSIREHIIRDIKQNMTPEEYKKIKRGMEKKAFLQKTRLPSSLYQLFTLHDDKHTGLTQQEIWRIVNILRSVLQYFPGIKVFITVSNTDSKDARRVKRVINGRKRTVVEGKRVPTHVHIGAIGNYSQSAKSFMFLVHDRLKNAGIGSRIQSKGRGYWAMNYMDYCYRQANSFHQYGKSYFDFKDYLFE